MRRNIGISRKEVPLSINCLWLVVMAMPAMMKRNPLPLQFICSLHWCINVGSKLFLVVYHETGDCLHFPLSAGDPCGGTNKCRRKVEASQKDTSKKHLRTVAAAAKAAAAIHMFRKATV